MQKVYIGHPDRGTSCVVNMKYTRFEKARIIGSRALQISYGAPVLVDYSEKLIDPIDIAMLEYEEDMIPIIVIRN